MYCAMMAGILLILFKIVLWIYRYMVHSILKISSHSIPSNILHFFLQLMGTSFLFAFFLHLLKGAPEEINLLNAWLGVYIYMFLYSISAVMPMREEWSYTRNGPLLSRAYVDVFHPWLMMLLLPLLYWAMEYTPVIILYWLPVPFRSAFSAIGQLLILFGEEPFHAQTLLFTVISIFLFYHFLRGILNLRDYFVSLLEVVRGPEPVDKLATASENTDILDESQQEKDNTVAVDDGTK